VTSKSLEELSSDLNVASLDVARAVSEVADEVETEGSVVVMPLDGWVRIERELKTWREVKDAFLAAVPRAELLKALHVLELVEDDVGPATRKEET